ARKRDVYLRAMSRAPLRIHVLALRDCTPLVPAIERRARRGVPRRRHPRRSGPRRQQQRAKGSAHARDEGGVMPKPFQTWTVYPHKPIEKIQDNLWRVEAPFPGAPFPRSMILVRLGDGRIIVHNAIALDEDEMREIEAWGKLAFLIVPNGGHRM